MYVLASHFCMYILMWCVFISSLLIWSFRHLLFLFWEDHDLTSFVSLYTLYLSYTMKQPTFEYVKYLRTGSLSPISAFIFFFFAKDLGFLLSRFSFPSVLLTSHFQPVPHCWLKIYLVEASFKMLFSSISKCFHQRVACVLLFLFSTNKPN